MYLFFFVKDNENLFGVVSCESYLVIAELDCHCDGHTIGKSGTDGSTIFLLAAMSFHSRKKKNIIIRIFNIICAHG